MAAFSETAPASSGVLPPRNENRPWQWTRILVAFALLEWALWTAPPVQGIASLLFIAWIVTTTLSERRPARDLGLAASGFSRAAALALPFAAAAVAMILIVASLCGTLRPLFGARAPAAHVLGYALWALLQQFILNAYFYATLERLLTPRRAYLGAVALFTVAHIPNPVLLLGTLLASLFLVWVFQRSRNIYPLGIAHAGLGLAVAVSVPDTLVRHMRVGLSFFHFLLR